MNNDQKQAKPPVRCPTCVAVVASAVAYAATVAVGFLLPSYDGSFCAIWPAAGVGLAVMLLNPRRRWPALCAALFGVSVSVNVSAGIPVLASLAYVGSNLAESVLCAVLLQSACGPRISFAVVREVGVLLLGAVLVNGVTTLVGAATAVWAFDQPFWLAWRIWWVADGLGIVLLAPALVTWARPRSERRRLLSWEWVTFLAVWLAALKVVYGAMLGQAPIALHPYALVALLAWPALRLGPRAVTLALVVLATATLSSDAVIHGPLTWGGADLVARVGQAQVFLGFACLTGLLLAASSSESRTAVAELRHSESLYRSVVESTDELIARIDSTARITYVNAASRTFVGLPPAACVGRSALDFVHPEDRERTDAAFEAWTTNGGNGATLENRVGTPEWGWRDVLWTVSVLRDAGGKVTDITSIARDITQRKATEARSLHDARVESVGRLAGGLAHDFNNTLHAVLGHVDLALETVGPDDPLFADLSGIRALATRAALLTNQLLAFAAQQPTTPRIVDLNSLLVSAEPLLRPMAGDRISIIRSPGADLWPVRVDPVRIEQAVAALVDNSRDAIAGEGTITLATRNHTIVEGDPIAAPPGDYVMLSVIDNGSGMSAETLAHLFEPFFTTKSPGHGPGLGLAAVHGIVERLGGVIAVSSQPDKGTRADLYLPACPEAEPSAEAPATAEPDPATANPRTILFVDDEDAIRRVSRRLLQRRGYHVIEASSAEEALAVAESHGQPIDLLITDIVMPGRGGLYLRDRMAELSPSTRCLLISGFTRDSALIGEDFLAKPFGADALLGRVSQLLTE